MIKTTKPIIKDPRRWLVLIAFSLLNFSNAIGYVNLNGIIECAALYYAAPPNQILFIVNLSNVIFVIFGWLAIPLLTWRLDMSVMGSAILTCASFWLRYLSRQSLISALMGSSLNSLAQVIVLPGCIHLPEVWFPIEERNLAFGIPFYLNTLGLTFGYIFPCIYLSTSHQGCYGSVNHIQLVCAIIATAMMILVGLLMRNKPKSSQSKKYMQEKKLSLRTSFRNILCHGENIYNISLLALFLGLSWSIFDMLGFVLGDININQGIVPFSVFEIGVLACCFCFSGTIAGLITSFWIMKNFMLKKEPKIDKIIKIMLSIGFIGFLITSVLTAVNFYWFPLYAFLMMLMGIGFTGYIPSACQSLVENIFPNRQVITSTLFFVCTSIYAQCINGLIGLEFSGNIGLMMICAFVVLPLLYTVGCYKTRFKRYKFSTREEKRRKIELVELEVASMEELPAISLNSRIVHSAPKSIRDML